MVSELKPGWRRVKFGQLAECVNDRVDDPSAAGVDRYVGLEHLDPESLTIRRWGSPDDVASTKLRFKPGDIIFGKRRAYQRKLAVADFEGICSAHAMVLRAKPAAVMPAFLPFLMQSDAFMERAVEISVGSLSPTINWKTLAEQEFALPPLEEQRRIAEAAHMSLRARDSLRAAIDAADRLADSFCTHVVTSVATKAQTAVGKLAKFSSGKSIPVTGLPQKPSDGASVPVYGGNGIAGYTSAPLPGVDSPTVVIGRVGQFCGVTQITSGSAWITDNALYPVALDDGIDMAFLALALRGRHLNRGKLGEYLPLITQKVVHATLIPVPSKSQQNLLVETLHEIEGATSDLRLRLQEAEALHRRVLDALSHQNGATHGIH